MKNFIMMISLCILGIVMISCEKTEFGYIESLAGTVWQQTGQRNGWIFDFKSYQLIWKTSTTTHDDLTWSCSSAGKLNIYCKSYIGSEPYMTGTFDKYKGTLIISGEKYKLLHKKD